MDSVRIERRAAKRTEIRNQACVRRVAKLQVLLLRDPLIHARADQPWLAEVAMKPWSVVPGHASARHTNHYLNEKFQQQGESRVKNATRARLY